METLESRRFLSGAGGIIGEYHGVLRVENLTTRVILTLNTLSKDGVVTGTLKAGKLGDFNVAGRAQRRRLSLVLNDNDSTAQPLAASSATFSAPNRGDGNLRGSFVQSVNSSTVSGTMRLRFLKDLTTSSSSSNTVQTGTVQTTSTTQTALESPTLDISGTTPMGSSGSLDISGTTPMGSSGSLDISGTTPTAPQSGTLDITGTTPGGTSGAPDISGSNSNNGLGSLNSSIFVSMFGGTVVFFG
jgi:hypothetical protein